MAGLKPIGPIASNWTPNGRVYSSLFKYTHQHKFYKELLGLTPPKAVPVYLCERNHGKLTLHT